MAKLEPAFVVDRAGLAKVLARRGKSLILAELVSNAWDEAVTTVKIETTYANGTATLVIEDDCPTGFADIADAYTLFAESKKKADAKKRGRFNLGEKFAVALCDKVILETTTGTVIFTEKGRTMEPAVRASGTTIYASLKMTSAEYDSLEDLARRLLPPYGIATTWNGEPLEPRATVRTFEAQLRTELADEEGYLRPTRRATDVELYEPLDGETAMIYELGIPVVETGDKYHVNVMQKVPLNTDRDNVTPAYLRDIRRLVLEHTTDLLDEETASQAWVTEAAGHPDASAEAVTAMLDQRFGKLRASIDPRDPEANKLAMSEGYALIGSRTLPKEVWAKAREHGLVQSAAILTPSPQPYAEGAREGRKSLPPEKWTDGMKKHAEFAQAMASKLMNVNLEVEIVDDPGCMNFSATYGQSLWTVNGKKGLLEYNLRVLGRKWFDRSPLDKDHLSLLIHEFGHEYCSDHLDRQYLNALCDLGATFTNLALTDPGDLLAYQ